MVQSEHKPTSVNSALSDRSPEAALHKVSVIFLTTPVGSVSCERSFSALRLLKPWTRSTMTEERLSGLVMLRIYRSTVFIPQPDEVYAKKSNWRQLAN